MEIVFNDYKYKDNFINFTIKDNQFNGLTGKDYAEILSLLHLKNNYKGKIYINKKEIQKSDINFYKRKISIIREDISDNIFSQTIYDLMTYEIRRKKLNLKNPEKKIFDSLKIVSLDSAFLNRNIYSLSSSEKKLIQIAISLLSNPDLIIIEEPFKYLDKINEKKIIMLLQKIKEQYQKTIVFVSNNSDILYKYTTHLIIIKNNKILLEGDTYELYQRVDYLKRNKIDIPEIVEFTYLARKKKNIKIDYHKDVRDIIKDIYKHV